MAKGWLAMALWLWPLVAAAEAPRLTAVVDLAAGDGGFSAVEAFAGQLPEFPGVIGLDLTVKPDAEGRLGVQLIRSDSTDPVTLDCGEGYGFVGGGYSEIVLPFGSIYPHLLMSIRLNGLDEADGLVLACEYTSPGAAQLRLQGKFVVSMVTVPTAYSVVLSARPVE